LDLPAPQNEANDNSEVADVDSKDIANTPCSSPAGMFERFLAAGVGSLG